MLLGPCVALQVATAGVHSYVLSHVVKGTPVMLMGLPMNTKWVVDSLKQACDPTPLTVYTINVYIPADNKPFKHSVHHLVLVSNSGIEYRVWCLPAYTTP